MAGTASGFREELVHLGEELFEGHANHQEYERRLKRLQSKYDLNPSGTTGGEGTVRHGAQEFDFQFEEITPAHSYQLHPAFHNSKSNDSLQSSARAAEKAASIYTAEIPPPQDKSQISKPWEAVASVEAFIKEWTPFTLVASYFVFSTCLYMICDGELISIFWFIYLTTNFYIAGSTVIEAIMSIAPCRDARRALRRIQENDWTFPTPEQHLPILDLVTVAYLPNEKVWIPSVFTLTQLMRAFRTSFWIE